MDITRREKWPEWLQKADTINPKIQIKDGIVHWYGGEWVNGKWPSGVWHNGIWHDGIWRIGEWLGGEWRGGEWHNGVWRDGKWRSGIWRNGAWLGGKWCGGEWHDGMWFDGEWYDGEWHDGLWYSGEWRDLSIDRLHYMASLAGLSLIDEKIYIGYRITKKNGRGIYNDAFTQLEGYHYEEHIDPMGMGTCTRGIHVASAARALRYSGRKLQQLQLWRVRFSKSDLLDCDGEKARIRGGYFEKVEWPF